jgi:hypothetical protein
MKFCELRELPQIDDAQAYVPLPKLLDEDLLRLFRLTFRNSDGRVVQVTESSDCERFHNGRRASSGGEAAM